MKKCQFFGYATSFFGYDSWISKKHTFLWLPNDWKLLFRAACLPLRCHVTAAVMCYLSIFISKKYVLHCMCMCVHLHEHMQLQTAIDHNATICEVTSQSFFCTLPQNLQPHFWQKAKIQTSKSKRPRQTGSSCTSTRFSHMPWLHSSLQFSTLPSAWTRKSFRWCSSLRICSRSVRRPTK